MSHQPAHSPASPAPASPAQRNSATGYWGRDLCRRAVGNAIFQLHEANAPPEVVVPHGHAHAHIVFVTAGAYVTSVTGENGFVATPVAVMNPPGTWHRDHFVGGTGSFMTVDLHHEGLAEDHPAHDQSHAALAKLWQIACQLRTAETLSLEDDAAGLIECFEPPFVGGAPDDMAVARAREAIMDSRAPWTLSMAELAKAADMHPGSLPRAFRAQYGRTASQIAKARRIELCASWLGRSDASLADAADEFGFFDQAHMTNSFRQVTGVSPARWLRAARGG